MLIWVVKGIDGEYSDRTETCVIAYATEFDARAYVEGVPQRRRDARRSKREAKTSEELAAADALVNSLYDRYEVEPVELADTERVRLR